MTAIRRDGNRVLLLLDSGSEVPVSRARVAALRKMLVMRQDAEGKKNEIKSVHSH